MTINGYTGNCECCPATDCEVVRVGPCPALEMFVCLECAQATPQRVPAMLVQEISNERGVR